MTSGIVDRLRPAVLRIVARHALPALDLVTKRIVEMMGSHALGIGARQQPTSQIVGVGLDEQGAASEGARVRRVVALGDHEVREQAGRK